MGVHLAERSARRGSPGVSSTCSQAGAIAENRVVIDSSGVVVDRSKSAQKEQKGDQEDLHFEV